MSALTWSALAFLLAVLGAGTALTAALGLDLWRRLRVAGRAGEASLLALTDSLGGLEGRLQALDRDGGRLDDAAWRLSASVRRARVLAAALRDIRDTVSVSRAFLPRK